jgi:hypothetical protein
MTIPPDHPKNEPDPGIYNVRALLDGVDEGRDPQRDIRWNFRL